MIKISLLTNLHLHLHKTQTRLRLQSKFGIQALQKSSVNYKFLISIQYAKGMHRDLQTGSWNWWKTYGNQCLLDYGTCKSKGKIVKKQDGRCPCKINCKNTKCGVGSVCVHDPKKCITNCGKLNSVSDLYFLSALSCLEIMSLNWIF